LATVVTFVPGADEPDQGAMKPTVPVSRVNAVADTPFTDHRTAHRIDATLDARTDIGHHRRSDEDGVERLVAKGRH
jgi:hypothetical protein